MTSPSIHEFLPDPRTSKLDAFGMRGARLAESPWTRYFRIMTKLATWVLHFLLSGLGVFLVAKLLPGVEVRSFRSAVAFAVVLAIFNALAWSVLAPFTWTFSVLTFGLGILVINALVFLVAGKIVNGVRISGCFTAAIASLVVSLVNAAIHALFGV